MATTLGWILGRFLLPNLAVVNIGVALGILQWLTLQHRFKNAWTWILATTAGWVVGASLTMWMVPARQDFLAGSIIGLSVGIAQWLVLRREVHWSFWWIVISIVGWTTGMALLPGVMLTGVMAGAVTGIALVLLIQFPKKTLVS